MAGKFINTEVVNSLNAMSDHLKNRLDNPFYNFNAEKGTVVTYYNVDLNNMPLDKVTGMEYSSIGKLSNIKYNKISNFVIYGLERILVTINNTDEGTEAEEISGDAIILPNTIHPYAGDYFKIDTLKETCLFRVIDAQSDTFDNGANVWQIRYQLEHVDRSHELEEYNLGTSSHFIMTNTGTQYSTVIRDESYKIIEKIEEVLDDMRKYYKSIFYNTRVNSLIFKLGENNFYDSFVTEFIIRNKLLEDREDYTYIQHQVQTSETFPLDYDRSFYHIIETKKTKKFKTCFSVAYGELIDSKINVFSTRPEQYLQMIYGADVQKMVDSIAPGQIFEIFDTVLMNAINTNTKFGDDILSDIIIKYFNNENINMYDLDQLDMINYSNNIMLFYNIPVAMYILEYTIKLLMSKEVNS